MPRDLKEILAEAFPGAEIKGTEQQNTFNVTMSDMVLRVAGVFISSATKNDLGTFKNMTARPGVDWP